MIRTGRKFIQDGLKASDIGIYTICETAAHMLHTEKVAGQWWVELIDRASGKVRIVYFNRKDQALALFKGMSMPDIIRVYDNMRVPESPMYKAGVI